MAKYTKTKHLQQVQKLNPQPLQDLLEDIDHALTRCRPLVNAKSKDSVVDCFHHLSMARIKTQEAIQDGRNGK